MNVLHIKQDQGISRLGGFRRSIGLFDNDGHQHNFFSPIVEYKNDKIFGEYVLKNITDNVTVFKFIVRTGSYSKIPFLREVIINQNIKTVLKRYIGSKKFDIIYAHNLSTELSLAYYIKNEYSNPLIFEVHGLYSNVNGLKGIIRGIKFRKMVRHMMKYIDVFIAQTDELRKYIANSGIFPIDKITVVKNGIDFDLFNFDKYNNKRTEKLDLKKNRKIVLYSGYLDDVNGVDFLLKAINKIKNQLIGKVSFIVAGDGPFASRVKKFAYENEEIFQYMGTIHQDEMPLLYYNCDLFTLPRPSHPGAETMTPLKLLEAMAMKKLVLASNVGGIVEAMRPDREGIIFQKNNLENYCQKLMMILSQKTDLFHDIVENAHKRVFHEYNWDKSKNILNKLYASLRPRPH